MFRGVVVVYVVLLANLALGHICVVLPAQRGALNISEAGSSTCYRKTEPCGDNTPGPSSVTLGTNQLYTVFWQQNFNHYEPGYPGWMDISFACNDTGSVQSPSDFTQIAVVPDWYAHFQSTQTNYSLEIQIPDQKCNQGVLRARYNPHKPTENIFLQCSDITVVPQPSANATTFLYGIKYQLGEPSSKFVKVDSRTGLIYAIEATLPFTVLILEDPNMKATSGANGVIFDSVVGVDPSGALWYTAAPAKQPIGAPPSFLVKIEVDGKVSMYSYDFLYPLVSLNVWSSKNTIIGVGINKTENGTISFGVQKIVNLIGTEVLTFIPNQNIVNFMWSTLDQSGGFLYMLVGNENTAYLLQTVIFTIDLNTNLITQKALPSVQTYTFNAIHWDSTKNRLIALSPGKPAKGAGNSYYLTQWTLVTVNPTNGTVTKLFNVGPANVYNAYYGGATYNFDAATRTLYHVFHESEADGSNLRAVIGAINVDTGTATFTAPSYDLVQVYNLARV